MKQVLLQAVAYAKGEADTGRYRVHVPEQIDVRAIRKKLGMTQEEFAAHFGFGVNTLRHWEHGKRHARGARLAPTCWSSNGCRAPWRRRYARRER